MWWLLDWARGGLRETAVASIGQGGSRKTPSRRTRAGRGCQGGRRGVPAAAAGPRCRLVADEQRAGVARPRLGRSRLPGGAATAPRPRPVGMDHQRDDHRRCASVAAVARAPVRRRRRTSGPPAVNDVIITWPHQADLPHHRAAAWLTDPAPPPLRIITSAKEVTFSSAFCLFVCF